MPDSAQSWRLTMGANLVDGGVHFRVWAPDAMTIAVDFGERRAPLVRGVDDVWSGFVAGIGAGTLYRFRVNDVWSYPDPYSRSQPDGPHGPSAVVDPDAHQWRDDGWRGLVRDGLAVYECHVGTYSPEGTFDALAADLERVAGLGVNAIELMPVAEFPGERNWGYDGVDLFAPTRNYGGADALKRLVDAAHARGIGIILDVVYNHFGPDGNYLLQYAKDYLTDRYNTPWGDAVNFDGPRSEHVRRFVLDNARYWLNEYHIDGLRLDATFAIHDGSPRHILAELTAVARDSVPQHRNIVLIAETYENDARYLRNEHEGGRGFDAVWADDFHHVVHTIASHEQSGYYADYRGTIDELARTINNAWIHERRPPEPDGTDSPRIHRANGLPASSFVYFIQNHDQVGNRAFGRRLSHLVGVSAQKMWSALQLLLPYTPMLFMGQEFAASSRFHYFTDHKPGLGSEISEGRRREMASLASLEDPSRLGDVADPQALEAFLESRLDLRERDDGVGEQMYRLHAELLALRRMDDVLRLQDRSRITAIAASAQLLLVHVRDGVEQRLVALNAGVAIDAPPDAAGVPRNLASLSWSVVLSTEERRFGGTDDHVRFDEKLVSLPPYSVALLAARRAGLVARSLARVRQFVQSRWTTRGRKR